MTIWAVVPAAGRGSRMGTALPKPYLGLCGRTVIEHTLAALESHPAIARIIVALAAADDYWDTLPVARNPRIVTVQGGEERCHSVSNALAHLTEIGDEQDWVLVHDAARPCLRIEDLEGLISVVDGDPVGGLLACPVADTVKRGDEHDRVVETVSRARLWRALTPQMFRMGILYCALKSVLDSGMTVTDEAAAMEHAGYQPRLVAGHGDNIKITTPADLAMAEWLLGRQGSNRCV